MPDMVIKNGTVIDGTGRGGFPADVVVEGDRIVGVERAGDVEGAAVIDADGCLVCPGFVDIHSHADLSIHREDSADLLEPLVRQGITTFVGGNCGMGLAPFDRNRNVEAQNLYLQGFTGMDFGEGLPWDSMDGLLSHLERQGIPLNMGLLCPHGMLRLQALGQTEAPADARQVRRMADSLRGAMEQGALGLSTGLQYFPGVFSDASELAELGKALAPHDGRFCSHIRSYTTTTVARALDEVAAVAREHEIHAQISHIFVLPWLGALHRPYMKAVRFLARHPSLANALVPRRLVEGDMERVLRAFTREQERGTRFGMDVMPTTTVFSSLAAMLPPWCLAVPREEMETRGRDPAVRAEIVRHIEKGVPAWPHSGRDDWSLNLLRQLGYESTRIMGVASERNRHLEGRSLVEIAREQGKHPVEAALDLLLEEDGVLAFFSPGEPEDPFTVRTLYPALRHPQVAVVTDTVLMGFGRPSPLFYGCYPGFLGDLVRRKGLLGWEAAIRKCTSLPAENMGIADRGRIVEGGHADIVVLDPAIVGTDSDFRNPARYPSGVEATIINGKVVWDGEAYDRDARAGSVLRRT